MGVPHEDVVLAVNLYSGFLKISEYVHEIPVSEMSSLPRELSRFSRASAFGA